MTDFLVDDFDAARRFVAGLPSKVSDARFASDMFTGTPANWNPDHVVLVVQDGVPLALADCILGANGAVANASIVALPNCGGYGLRALLHMKTLLPVEHWESTLNKPTKATVAISRRYFDTTYDQAAWDISRALMRRHGLQTWAAPAPLLLSATAAKRVGVASIQKLDAASRSQVLHCALSPMERQLVGPNGVPLDRQDLMGLTFDVLSLRMLNRQQVSRLLLIMLAKAHGHDTPMNVLKRLANPKGVSEFHKELQAQADRMPCVGGGVFKIVRAETMPS